MPVPSIHRLHQEVSEMFSDVKIYSNVRVGFGLQNGLGS